MREPCQRDEWTHDLKNQLGIVLGFSELLLDGLDLADPRRADAQEIHTAACRALTLLTAVSTPSEADRP
jgi:signal transduction histidine kinase